MRGLKLSLCAGMTACLLVGVLVSQSAAKGGARAAAACVPATNIEAIVDDSGSMGVTDDNRLRVQALNLLIGTLPAATQLGAVFVGSIVVIVFLRGYLVSSAGEFRESFERQSFVALSRGDTFQLARQLEALSKNEQFSCILGRRGGQSFFEASSRSCRAGFFEVQESDDTIVISFEDKGQSMPGPLKIVLAKQPALELRKWITKDLQGRDTLIELNDMATVEDFEPGLFKPASIALEKLR